MSESQLLAPFPFTAIVGSEALKQALLINLVDPRVGGVLVRGDRGTAKSTAVRALAGLLPPLQMRAGCPVVCDPAAGHCAICGDAGAVIERRARLVELPLGATEDRIVGTIDLAHALASGERRFEAGLLGAAHRGILYIDEVNLLPDHLVDLLLDVAASGVNVVERDGATAVHPARFILVGTMNPEEGDLRPQLLDRFGLIVDVRTPLDVAARAEVVRRRIAYDADPAGFVARSADAEHAAREAIHAAQRIVSDVVVPPDMLDLIVTLCVEASADGLRADITLFRAAAAIAAMAGRVEVTRQDVLDAAPLVLAHRQHAPRPGDPPPSSSADRAGPSADAARDDHGDDRGDEDGPAEGGQGARRPDGNGPANRGDGAPPSPAGDRGPSDDTPAIPASAERVNVALPAAPRGRLGGRRVGASDGPRGRVVGARAWDGRSSDIAVVPTLLARLRRGGAGAVGRARVALADLRLHRRRAPAERLVLLLVDGSSSMGAREQMGRTKAGIRSVIDRVYQRRDRIAVQVFRAGGSSLIVPPGKNVAAARAAVESLPAGGGTPLRAGLSAAAALLRGRQRTHPGESSLLVLVTDARTRDLVHDVALEVAGVATERVVVDTEAGAARLGRARQVADWLGASYEPLG